ncbi:A-kinase anchor protein 200 isoform X2 [Drosophila miranda]|uniref:A-kinase anchor protein 200 isoform X2 n=1 Tax=Drosophila miranda TaxID=7229 RepID=UPI00143F0AB9|nr:A-kinase anchor protein 200 isoform X2 [Drosophila miranda]
MGKAQSKRSIDITTDPKKVAEGDAVAGKVEKIEDPDQKAAAPAVNGDAATPKESAGEEGAAGEKKDEEHSENDKDLTTEKSTAAAGEGASGDVAAAETPKSDASPEGSSPKEAAASEEISPLADEIIKSKSKKDKVKKKWSFRSISFGKKDKQKPAKSEEPVSPTSATTSPTTAEAAAPAAAAEPAATTIGEAEQPAAAAENASGAPATETTSKDEANPAENGSATEQEKQANGEGEKAAPSPATTVVEAEKPKTAEEPITATVTATTTETNVVAAAAVAITTEEAVKESQPEPAEVVTNGHGGAAAAGEALTNGDSNGRSDSPVTEAAAAENIPSSVDVEPHQNGTNGVSSGSATPPPTPVAVTAAESSEAEQIKNKSQIEAAEAAEEEAQVVEAIIQAVSSEVETDADSEGFVVVDPEIETESKTEPESALESPTEPETREAVVPVSPVAEIPLDTESVSEPSSDPATAIDDVVVEVRNSSPPPLPKSPPPSRVSAFVLAEDAIDEPEQTHTQAQASPTEAERSEIEKQAISIVDEITEQAADIVTEDQKEKLAEEELEQLVSSPAIVVEETIEIASSTSIDGSEVPAEPTPADDDDEESEPRAPEQEQIVESQSDDDSIVDNIISDQAATLITKIGELPQVDVRVDEAEEESNNKDIAKDLKEKNAAADQTTQELPVTCE